MDGCLLEKFFIPLLRFGEVARLSEGQLKGNPV